MIDGAMLGSAVMIQPENQRAPILVASLLKKCWELLRHAADEYQTKRRKNFLFLSPMQLSTHGQK